jgi:hypothetical protein
MTDHHDFGDHDYYHDDPLPYDDHTPTDDHHPYADEPWTDEPSGHFDLPAADDHHHPGDDPAPADETTDAALIDTETSAAAVADDPVDVFPPALEVDLPEPVDGFPWIDTGSLGLVDAGVVTAADHPVQPAELAEYAETDLPPAVDPWAALADSDDPATAALARWWAPE